MRIDVSRDSFDIAQGYTRVLLQQGRPILDRDWNEQTAIVQHQLRMVTRSIYGRHGGPAGDDCGFAPTISGNDIKIKGGWYTVDGLILNCKQEMDYFKQGHFKPEALENDKTYLIYLEAMEREVTAAENIDLLEAALPGVDMAARGQVVWRVNHDDTWAGTATNLSCCDVIEKVNAWTADKRAEQAVGNISFPDSGQAELKKFVTGKLNQLCRVEFHEDTEWKMSADNAFALFEVQQAKENKITFRLGSLESWAPSKGEYVELLSETNLRFNEPGLLRRVNETSGSDRSQIDKIDRRTLVLDQPVGGYGVECRFLRVWNDTIPLVLGSVNPKPGDYWQFEIRDANQTIFRSKLKRPGRVFAPLALVRTDASGVPEITTRFQRIVGIPWREIDERLDVGSVSV